MKTSFKILIIYGFVMNAFAYKEMDTNILDECRSNQMITGIQAECNDMYHYYPPVADKELQVASQKKLNTQIKIGGFNVFNMTTGQTKFKDLEIITDIISKWDVVGAVEVLPAMGDDGRANDFIRSRMNDNNSNNPMTLEEARKLYREPGYLKVLKILRNKYPEDNWGLILSPYTQSQTQELVAYYFKGSIVSVIENIHCKERVWSELSSKPAILSWSEGGRAVYKSESILPENGLALGCVPYFVEDIEKQFSRVPFMASFKAGNFDFTLLDLHARFRGPSEQNNLCKEECQKATKSMIDEEFDPEGKVVPVIGPQLLSKVIKQVKANEASINKNFLTEDEMKRPEVVESLKISSKILEKRFSYLIDERVFARFYETKKILSLMNELGEQGEKDIILMGDFNLNNRETVNSKVDYWKETLKALPGAVLAVKEKTSLSRSTKIDGGLSSSYDHFIFNSDSVTECDVNSAKAFDFRLEDFYQNTGIPYKIGSYLDQGKSSRKDEILLAYKESLKNQKIFKGTGNKQRFEPITEAEIEKEVMDFSRRVFDTQKDELYSQMVFQEIISDHLPVSIACTINSGDDD